MIALMGVGCVATEAPPSSPAAQNPPSVEDTPAPVAEVVSSLEVLPVDIAVDERYVYWITATSGTGPQAHGGSVVRWNKLTRERVVLATIDDAEPAEIDVGADYVYWSELHGWTTNGRSLSHDQLVRVAKTGGMPEVIATEQWFDTGSDDHIAVANGYVYWLSEGSPFNADGTVRRVSEARTLSAIETLADKLDTPTTLATDGASLCFRTGHPNSTSPIWCMPTAGGAIDPVAYNRFPYKMLFRAGYLHWSEGERESIERAWPVRGATIETVAMTTRPIALAADATNLFWTTAPSSASQEIRTLIGGKPVRIWASDKYPRAIASDGNHVYFVEQERVLRVPARP
jgi:hypothetical protein